MKSPRAVLAATAVPLLLASLPLTAGELPFNAPQTARAQKSAQPRATLHWSASIGTGHASSTDTMISSRGVPAAPHWTAQIGTGTAASGVAATEGNRPAPSNSQPPVAYAHWTSRIGTGHATEFSGRERS